MFHMILLEYDVSMSSLRLLARSLYHFKGNLFLFEWNISYVEKVCLSEKLFLPKRSQIYPVASTFHNYIYSLFYELNN